MGSARNRVEASLVVASLAGVSLAACAAPRAAAPRAASAARQAEAERWEPGPGAGEALEALFGRPPFGLAASQLAIASGGAVASVHKTETLLVSEEVRVDSRARVWSRTHAVYRILSDDPDNTLTLAWAPWRQERPALRARVVEPDGTESWLDPASLVEGTASSGDLVVSDVRVLRAALPRARRGAVVEVEIVRAGDRPLVEGEGAMRAYELWTLAPVRRTRIAVEAPTSVPLQVEAVGIERPLVERHGGTQRLRLEVGDLGFRPWRLTRTEVRERWPRLAWSTGPSWAEVARRYHALIRDGLDEPVDLSSLAPFAAGAKTPRAKAAAVLAWLAKRVRYTALHLGDGAIVPAKPSVVLARGFGDCKDLSVLAVIALRSLGVEADPAAVQAGGLPPLPGAPGLTAFNHMLVLARDTGGPLWIDATAPQFPAGVLPDAVRDQRALVLSPASTALVDTPSRSATPLTIRQAIDLELAPFGAGRARVRIESGAAAAGIVRSAAPSCDETAAHKLAQPVIDAVFGGWPFRARFESCGAGEALAVVAADVERAVTVDTGDLGAVVRLPSSVLDEVVTDTLRGPPAGRDDRTDVQKAEQRERSRRQYGLDDEELASIPFSFGERPSVERRYRITLPPKFVIGALPHDRSLAIGPAKWTETFRSVSASEVEVRFRFESERTEYTADDVKRFREAYWKRAAEPLVEVTAWFEPMRLLEQGRAPEAMALVKRWLDERPDDGPTRARFAQMLLNLGLNERARVQAERALRASPEDPLVLMVRADVARHDDQGQVYEPPFERATAVTCLKKALTHMPDHVWAALALAETLERNDHGETRAEWTPEVAEAAALLQGFVDRNRADSRIVRALSHLYLRNRRLLDFKRLVEQQPELRDSDDLCAVAAEAVIDGVDGILRRVEQIEAPDGRRAALFTSHRVLAHLRRFEEAASLLARFRPGAALAQDVAVMRAMNRDLRAAPRQADLTSPERAARSVFGIIANAPTATDAAQRLAALASTSGRPGFEGHAPGELRFARLPGFQSPYDWDLLFHHGRCVTDGDHATFRVRCEIPENRSLAASSYWVTEGGTLRLQTLGVPAQLARRAFGLAADKRLVEAALYMDWFIDELNERDARGHASLVKDVWSETDRRDASSVQLAAALANVAFPDLAGAAPAAVVDAALRLRPRLPGSRGRRVDEVLVSMYEWRGQHKEAVRILEPLARSEDEPRLWRWLAALQSRSGSGAAAMARINKALERDPGNADWRKLKAGVAARLGRYDEALEIYRRLREEKGEGSSGLRNDVLWTRLLADRLDDEAEGEAVRLSADESSSSSVLHTAAMVLLERGRIDLAAATSARRYRETGGRMDDAELLYRARLLQRLGFSDDSRAVYGKVGESDLDLSLLRERWSPGAAER